MTKTFFCGHDFGNSETDGVLIASGQEIVRSMPTAEAIAPSEKRARNLGVDLEAGNTVLFRMRQDNTTYMIGEGALTQSSTASTQRGNISRYTSSQSIRALPANSAMMTREKVYRLHVVTGVPVETYAEDDSIRHKIIDALSGTYTFLVNGGDERTVEVIVERVIAEGAGVIIGYGSNDKVLQGAIDCGGRTLDLYVSRGQTPQIPMCKSFVLGVESAIDLLKNNYQAAYNAALSTSDARAIMFAYTSAGRFPFPTLAARGVDVERHEQIHLAIEAIRVIGEQVASTVASAWSEGETTDQVATSFKNIFSIGRGAKYFYPFIQKVLAPGQLKQVDDPGSANAYGYASLARRLARHNLGSVAAS
jgi:plasmid segregation protein ParM